MARLIFPNSTIHGQITAVILICLTIIIGAGSSFERWVERDHLVPDIEEVSESVSALTSILHRATSTEREQIIAIANRGGWTLSLRPTTWFDGYTTASSKEPFIYVAIDWLFPPNSRAVPVGGWRTFVDGKRVLAARVDDNELLVLEPLPDGFLRSDVLSSGSNYLVALITLILLFSVFAVWAITRPLRRIASAAANADLSVGPPPFKESGSVEIVALARALNGMQRRISTMVEARTRMLRGISHDLRTPLTRLRLRAERVQQGDIKSALLADIGRIDRLLAESLGYLRDAHEREAFQRADLASVLRTVCDEFADMGCDITYRGPSRLIAAFKPLAVMRAVTNLCDNASKFGKHVEVKLGTEARTVVIEVADDGPGIPIEHRNRVLEPFYKIDTSRTKKNAGFGLGLSIVADIVQAHHGTLQFLERQPTGLLVRMTLPIKQDS